VVTKAPQSLLPTDSPTALLIGRVGDSRLGGPRVVQVRGDDVSDLTDDFLTVSQLCEQDDLVDYLQQDRPATWSLSDLVDASKANRTDVPHLLSPIDFQVIKACGVTFVDSMIERVIEEKCAGDPKRAEAVREQVQAALGGGLRGVTPGSARAEEVKNILIQQGLWSAYLEVGIGPYAEVFTKAPVLSSVGFGALVGIPTFSQWNNPEPELVLVVSSGGSVIGATLGNDVNLRDIEGRSALLLGKAKDNNRQCSLGPFIRVFDGDVTLDTVAQEIIHLEVVGEDGFAMTGTNSVQHISRPLRNLVEQTIGEHHQYPDGLVLFTGTLFAPSQDRDTPGSGFTHKPGDQVSIWSHHLGLLANTTGVSEHLPPWEFGIGAFLDYARTHHWSGEQS
jgi:fumarylacetoacetate (FAA) hydrolase family protein